MSESSTISCRGERFTGRRSWPMGHTRIGTLPASKKSNQVISLILGGADIELVAAVTSEAAEASLADAARDPALRHSFWLLTQIPLAAKAESFADELGQRG